MLKHSFDIKKEYDTMSPSLKVELLRCLQLKHFKKNAIILQEGDICDGVYFIRQGCCRTYLMNGAKDITTSVAIDNQLIFATDSFLEQEESSEYIQAIEDTQCCFLSFEAYEHLLAKNLEFNKFVRRVRDNYFINMASMLNSIRAQSALERYEYFMEEKPMFIQRVPLRYLASLLGMSKETLSRMRSQI